jgi:hypothetical protein
MRRHQTLLSIRLTCHSTSQYPSSSSSDCCVKLRWPILGMIISLYHPKPHLVDCCIMPCRMMLSHPPLYHCCILPRRPIWLCMMLSCPTSISLANPLPLQYPSSVNCSIIPNCLTSVSSLSLLLTIWLDLNELIVYNTQLSTSYPHHPHP